MVHCGTPPVLMHIAQGMYMAIIVDPKDGYGTKADKEFVIVQSEFYAKDGLTADGAEAGRLGGDAGQARELRGVQRPRQPVCADTR